MSGVIAAIAVVSAASTYLSVDNADHAQDAANTAAANAQSQASGAVALSNAQFQAKQNAVANTTQTAQNRVRAIANPDSTSLMTSPLGQTGQKPPANVGQTPPAGAPPSPISPQVPAPGKTTIGG